MAQIPTLLAVVAVASFGALIGLSVPGPREDGQQAPASATFSICHMGGGVNCVVDGDTAWITGTKYRIADIDAPETHPPRCPHEAELGDKATVRLAALLNDGPFELKPVERDADRFGRKLRLVVRRGHSLGDQLVAEGLARTWDGARHPWC
jgi:endonuclease YncB( thermonuclease family)